MSIVQCNLCMDLGNGTRGELGCRNCGRTRPRKQLRIIAPRKDWYADQEKVNRPIVELRQTTAAVLKADRKKAREEKEATELQKGKEVQIKPSPREPWPKRVLDRIKKGARQKHG